MFKDFLGKIKSIFKAEKAPVNVTADFTDQSRKLKKNKKLKNSTDYSTDKSTTVNGDVTGDIDNSVQYNYYSTTTETTQNTDLIISARWLKFVPAKIERVNNGLDYINILVKGDEGYIPTSLSIDLDAQANNDHAIHILVKSNPFIRNLKLHSISIDGESCKTNHTVDKDIFGLLDEDRSFAVNGKKYIECSAQITIVFKFERDKCEYLQKFEFTAQKNGTKFVLNRYNQPRCLTF